jgi:hypothetical protein
MRLQRTVWISEPSTLYTSSSLEATACKAIACARVQRAGCSKVGGWPLMQRAHVHIVQVDCI